MVYLLNRRDLFKVLAGGIFSGFTSLFGINKFSINKDFNSKMNIFKSITTLPNNGPWPTMDPFLFCVHHNDKYPPASKNFIPKSDMVGRNIGNDFSNINGWNMYHGETVPGFPRHPHRGFETLTIVEKGYIDHSDSLGAKARYGEGDSQWLTAGNGINHSEMFPLFNQKEGNELDFFQIWINLPSKSKRVNPNFLMFWKNKIPKIELKDANGIGSTVEIISGDFGGVKAPEAPPNSWASNPDNHVAVWVIYLKNKGQIRLPKCDKNINRCLYLMKDTKITLNDKLLDGNKMVELYPDKSIRLENNSTDTKILLLQGRPINEPVAKYGPFVMNTRQEIEQAFHDYNSNGFGGWKWEKSDPTHGSFNGKFARLPDGKFDNPS
jgi:redox-sensitive bicupin YhaK (pirin superfamily)